MRIRYLICSDSFSIDSFTNRVSLFHLMEQINAPSFPIAIPSLSVIVCAEKEEHDPDHIDIQIRISIDGNSLTTYEMRLDMADALFSRAVGTVQGFFIPSPGIFLIEAVRDDDVLAKWEIHCSQAGQPELQFEAVRA